MRFRICFLAASLAFAAGSANALVENDYEPPPPWVEGAFALPPSPVGDELEAFYVSAVTNNDFFLDRRTISIGEDGVVRYAMVVRSFSGVQTATFEGIRCESGEWRMYATASRSGEWTAAKVSKWRRIEETGLNRSRAALAKEYLCENGFPVQTVRQALDNLRRSMRRY